MGRDRVYEKAGERLPFLNGDLAIVLISIFSVIFGGYFYCYRSFESYILSKKDLENERIKLEAAETRLKNLEKEMENEKAKGREMIPEGKKLAYFKNIFEFKEKIDSFLKTQEIEVISIASQEKEGERIYLAYFLEGDEENLVELLKKIEAQHEALTLLNSPIKMLERSLEIKIGGYFKEAEFENEEIRTDRKEKIFSKRDVEIEFYPLGIKKGIAILMKEGEYPKRVFLEEEAEIEYSGEVYRLKIEKGRVKIQ